ncbi:hypothetical protein Cri9333_2260 [Crinalium epipsammum PCC 9333]|uniref:Uncharacterized protein n=1 Tax=Crinalium epipsammum PCC 9333 TaxID=1173022 RepID=K9W136_9CYAN|nr:hypothetical protein [Crinalium epipsammum]AFZ13130.1 hypothetical protein Cri9333_2260 [Crinalium epipsammum PCC 9333]
MQLQINLIPGAIGDLYADVSTSGFITLADRYGLMTAILEDTLSPDEESCVNRLLRAACREKLTVSDELSLLVS